MFENGFPKHWSTLKKLIWLVGSGVAGSSAVIKTVKGAIVHILDALAKPAISLVCEINPVQEGSGDPSPDNVRPITGFTGLNLNRTARNILPIGIVSGLTYNKSAGGEFAPPQATGNSWTQGTDRISYITSSTYTNCALITPLLPPGNYTYKATKLSAGTLRITAYALDKSFTVLEKDASSNLSDKQLTFSLPNGGYIAFYLDNGNTASQILELQIQVEPGSTAHDYLSYIGETIPVSWQTEAGTVYGGNINLTTGVLTVERWGVDASTLTWQTRYTEEVNKTLSTALPKYYKQRGIYLLAEQYAERPSTNLAGVSNPDQKDIGLYPYTATGGVSASTIYAVIPKDTTPGGLITWNLYEPVTYQLDPVTVNLLLGENNLWHDANGNTELTYYADGTASTQEALGILLGGAYHNPGGDDDVTVQEALNILMGNG